MTSLLLTADDVAFGERITSALQLLARAFELPASQQAAQHFPHWHQAPGSVSPRFSLRTAAHRAASTLNDRTAGYADTAEKGFARTGSNLRGAAALSDNTICRALTDALRRAVAGRDSPIKRLSRVSGKSERTVQNHLDGTHQMSAADLIRYLREFDIVYEAVKELSNRTDVQLTDRQRKAVVDALQILVGDN